MVCDDPRDRPANEDEIEVTPEMIEAGVSEFRSYDSRYDDARDIVRDIFLAMVMAQPRE